MKKCSSCGAIQNDERSVCIDCGKVLGKPLDQAEMSAVEAATRESLDNMAERTDDFYVPIYDKIFGIVAIIGIIAAIILLVLVGKENARIQAEIPDGVIVERGSGFTTILSDGEVDYTYPSMLVGKLNNVGTSALISLVCLIIALPMLIVPKFMWFIDTLRYRIFYNWDTTPSFFALVLRKGATYILFICGAISVIYGYCLFF